ncbi:hypothetical protein ACO0RG_000289 [Hanseniaspora osmophila]
MDTHVDKKPKIGETTVDPARCEFHIVKKNRQCGMLKSKQSTQYCTEHLLLAKRNEGAQLRNNNTKKGNRVPCPLDNNHTVWEIDLKKHLKKCTKGKSNNMNAGKPWFVPDVNCGQSESSSGESKSTQELILQVIPVLQKLQELNMFDGDNIPRKEILKDQHVQDHRVEQLLGNQSRHAVQQSSLIQHIRKSLNKNSNKTGNPLFVEFGCGRAELSRYLNLSLSLDHESDKKIADESKPSMGNLLSFLLIDRGANRLKFDHKFAEDCHPLPGPVVKREKADIKDIDLNALIECDFQNHDELNVVSVSKHLCGVATDLTLRCLEKSMTNAENNKKYSVCIAMCCRHVCNFDDYVNPLYISSLLEKHDSAKNLKASEFFYSLTKICSWATCGRRPDVDIHTRATHFTKLSIEEREQLGMISRRIIDTGRLEYIQQCDVWKQHTSSSAKLVQYCDLSTSLENVALVV